MAHTLMGIQPVSRQQIAEAWHDVTCPEAEDCRDRALHVMAAPIVNTGIAERFVQRLGISIIRNEEPSVEEAARVKEG